jgi:DNA-binding MarR family transcriptional regulator
MLRNVTADAALASELRTTVMRLARRLRAQRSVESLSLGQLAALGTLDRHGPMTPGELAGHERIQPPSATRILNGLADAGLVTREAHPEDGRQVVVSPSEEGRALLREDRRRRDAWLAQRLRDLSPDELDTLRAASAVLTRLAQS